MIQHSSASIIQYAKIFKRGDVFFVNRAKVEEWRPAAYSITMVADKLILESGYSYVRGTIYVLYHDRPHPVTEENVNILCEDLYSV